MKHRANHIISFAIALIFIFLPVFHSAAANDSDFIYEYNTKIKNDLRHIYGDGTDPKTLELYKQPRHGYGQHEPYIIELAQFIVKDIKNDYDKIKAVHDWVASNIWYDYDYLNGKTQNSGVKEPIFYARRGLCDDYALLAVDLLRSVGIPAKFAEGVTKNQEGFYDFVANDAFVWTGFKIESHAWCEAYADGRWIIFDPTVDSLNEYKDGIYSPRRDCLNYYFDISLKDISSTHKYVGYGQFADIMQTITIPNSFTRIEKFAFDGMIDDYVRDICRYLTKVIIPETIKSIGEFAFADCVNLREVNIPGSVEKIEKGTFFYCERLTTVTLSDGIKSIEDSAFAGCTFLERITIPNSVTSIGDVVFFSCRSLKEVIIPESVTSIGEWAFAYCPNLTIYGKTGSYAEAYANKNNIKFEAILPPVVYPYDQPSQWAHSEIDRSLRLGLITDTFQSRFKETVTRAEFCELAVTLYENITGKEILNRRTFYDTRDINVEKAAAIGVVNGIGNGLFNPSGELTREQAATMLARLANATGQPLEKKETLFYDKNEISPYAAEAVGQIEAAGIMNGTGNNRFSPKSSYTREQSVITIVRLYDFLKIR